MQNHENKNKTKTKLEWKHEVHSAAEKTNLNKLKDDCYETTPEGKKAKSKTLYALEKVNTNGYRRKPMQPLTSLNQVEAKTLVLARFRMLECGKNFRGMSPEICTNCNKTDNEHHRLNLCSRFRHTNLCDSNEKVAFADVLSDDAEKVKNILKVIMKVWNIRHGGMN